MKKTDIAMIVLIAAVSVLVAYFVTNSLLGEGEKEEQSVKTIDRIETDIATPDPRVFNQNAINPTVEVFIDKANQ